LKMKFAGGLEVSRVHGVSAKFSPELLARLDAIAAGWGLNRAATLRRLVEFADVCGRRLNTDPPAPVEK
jgi:hypothetical protein